MRLAYLILAHQLPEQVIRLVQRLLEPDATFLIHIDRKLDDHSFVAMKRTLAASNVHFLPRHLCHWATFSIVRATNAGIRAVVEGNHRFDYLILLSGQDYPIKPVSQVKRTLREAGGRSFLHHVPLPKSDWRDGGWNRIEQWFFPPQRRYRWAERYLNRWLVPRRFPRGLRPFAGAQFWCLSEEAARYVHRFTVENPRVVRFFHHVFSPDEMYFQTVLANSPLKSHLINDTLHFLEWHRPGAVLDSGDLGNLRSTYHLFARKFDVRVDARVLDLIDEELLGLATAGQLSV